MENPIKTRLIALKRVVDDALEHVRPPLLNIEGAYQEVERLALDAAALLNFIQNMENR